MRLEKNCGNQSRAQLWFQFGREFLGVKHTNKNFEVEISWQKFKSHIEKKKGHLNMLFIFEPKLIQFHYYRN